MIKLKPEAIIPWLFPILIIPQICITFTKNKNGILKL